MAQARKLSEDLVITAALEQLQEGGLDSVSLRNVAQRLDSRAPSLARHVGEKGRLLALMSARLFGEALDTIPPGLAGAEWLTAFGQALRAKQATTRDIAALIAQAPPVQEIDRQVRERLAALMAGAGLTGRDAEMAQRAIQALVTGWMVFETSARHDSFVPAAGADDTFARSLAALIAGFGPAA